MFRTLIAAAAGLLIVVPTFAGEGGTEEPKLRTRPHRVKPQPVTATSAKSNTKSTLQRIRWRKSLADLEAAARKSGKMMLWMQIVGELDGGL